MSSEKVPEGQLFTHVYCDRGTPLQDSKKLRRRIGKFGHDLTHDYNYEIGTWLIKETGLEVPIRHIYYIDKFFLNIELIYMLNLITLVWRFLNTEIETYHRDKADSWHTFVKRALSEENMGYKLDNSCGVHYLIDEEFERNRISAIRLLQDSKYSPQMVDTKNLNSWIVKNTLKEIALRTYEADQTAHKVVGHLFDGFAEWVDGMHNYRHGQDATEPVAPPLDLAVYIISSGTSFLRWLVEIDQKIGA